MDLYRFLLNDFKSLYSLSKVLLIFPSQYLFAIGFPFIFSFRRCISPILGCISKQPDSKKASFQLRRRRKRGFHPLWHPISGYFCVNSTYVHPHSLQFE